MPLLLRPFRHRWVIVAVWLVAAVQFLIWQRPQFWHTPFTSYAEARTFAELGRDAEALNAIARAIRQGGRDPGYYTLKGYVELRAGRYEDARQSFSEGLALRPRDHELVLGLAEALAHTGRPADARQALQGLDASTLTADMRFRRQSLYAVMKDFDLALGDTALLDSELTTATQLIEGLRWAMAGQKWERALSLADRVTAAAPDETLRREVTLHRATALDALGRYEEALSAYSEVATDENLPTRARLASQIKRHDEAATMLDELLERNPDDVEIARNLAFSLEQTGRLRETVYAYREALKLNDDLALRLRLWWRS